MGENTKVYDVTIIGGGTTGLFTAFCCGMRGMTTKIIESGSQLGGKVAQFLPEKLIYDVGGIPQITGDDLAAQMIEQASKHQPTISYNQWIESIAKDNDGIFSLTATDGTVHQAKSIILATGTGKFDPVPLNLDDSAIYNQKSLHYALNNLQQFTGKHVMISSNNRVGVDWALTLEGVAEKVYLINSKNTFQHASDQELQQLNESSIIVKYESDIQELHGEDGWLNQVIIQSNQQTVEQIEIDHLLTYNGLKMIPAPFQKWGLKTDANRVVVDHHMATSTEGIFAAGDATVYLGKSMLIASGYNEGITAVNSANKYIDPKAPMQVYSTVIYRK